MLRIPGRLLELIADRRLIPFLGSGFSIPSGVPSWPSLVSGLKRLAPPEVQEALSALVPQLNQADVAEVLDQISPTEFAAKEYLVEHVNSVRFLPSDYHSLLLGMRWDTIITTNWDMLVESYLAQHRIPFHVIYRDAHVSQYDPERAIQILKLHGTITEPESIVYRQSQYDTYWAGRPLMLNLVCTLMATRSFLFLGYGFGDPNILRLFDLLRDRLGALRREHYALVYGASTLDTSWQRLGVTRLDATQFGGPTDSYENVTRTFLAALLGSARGVSLTNLERARLVNEEIRRLIDRRPPKATLRMRGALGWLSNPDPVSGDPIYGTDEQDREERRMTELVSEFLESVPMSSVRCILHFEIEPLLVSGYRPSHIIRRLTTVREMLQRFAEQVEIAHDLVPSHLNLMIFDDHASLLGFKQSGVLGISRATLKTHRQAVRAEAEQFDADFEEIRRRNQERAGEMGLDVNRPSWRREFLIRLLEEEIAAAESREDVASVTVAGAMFGDDIATFSRATEFAISKHRAFNQTREDGVTPYGVHIVRVAERVRTVGLVERYEILAAAALHDVIEDCAVSVAELEALFGERVATIVRELSREPDQPRDAYIAQLRGASTEAKTIKLADRWDNVVDLCTFSRPVFGGRPSWEYLDESGEVLDACGGANFRLAAALEDAIRRGSVHFSRMNE